MITKAFRQVLLVAGAALALSAGALEARDIKVQRKATPVATTATSAPALSASVPVAWTAAPVTPAPTMAAAPETPACARKVKVIYAGYGEANRAAPCAVATN